MSAGDPECTICGRPYGGHSGETCPACGVPVEHHTEEEQIECWRARARPAACKRAVGLPLNEVDVEALRREPDPEFLTAHDGYQRRTRR